MLKVLTTNEVSLTILPKANLVDKIKYPGAAANRAKGEHGLSMMARHPSHTIGVTGTEFHL